MAGIKANSLSVSMLDGDTAADKTIGGYLNDERITLTVTPTGSTYVWSLTRPETSTLADLSAETGASVTLTPDKEGVWYVSVLVDSTTTYQIRMTVANISVVNSVQAVRLYAQPDAAIPTPLTNAITLFKDDDTDGLSYKKDDGSVVLLGAGSVPSAHAATHITGGSDEIDAATTTTSGLMSAADKVTLDSINTTLEAVNERSGFPNRTDSTIAFDSGTRTFTISPAVTSFDFYIVNEKHTKSSAQSVVWPNSTAIHYIYFNTSGTLVTSTTEADWLNAISGDGSAVALVYWDSVDSLALLRGEERHGLSMSAATHVYLHLTQGAQWESGGQLGNITADASGNSDSSATLSVANVVFHDEDIRHEISNGSPQTLSPTAQIPVYWRNGSAGDWKKRTANDFPIIYSGDGSGYVGGSGRVPFNEQVGGNWQLTEIASNNDFVLVHFMATNDVLEPVIAIMGQNEYTSRNAARAGATVEMAALQLGEADRLTPETIPLATVIYQTSNGYSNTPAARIVSTDTGADYVSFVGLSGTGVAASIVDHDALTGVAESTSHLKLGAAATDVLAFYGATGSARGAAYTVTNPVDRRSFDTTTVTLSQLAEVVGTLIADHKGTGLIE